MSYIVLRGGSRHRLRKRITTVGTGEGSDIRVAAPNTKSAEPMGMVFTIVGSDKGYELYPAGARLKINGTSVHRAVALSDCDRIEWAGASAVFVAKAMSLDEESASPGGFRSLEVLHNLSTSLQDSGSFRSAIHQTLDALVELSGAEAGYLLSEMGSNSSSWEMVASQYSESQAPGMKGDLLSNTILREALGKRDVVYVENMIGHPLAVAASVIEARIFSVACIPLCVGERAFGAVFLMTRSPGRSIRREALGELKLLATQALLMVASQAQLSSARKENERLKRLVPEWPSELIYERERSSGMRELDRKIEKLSATPLTVLILGETGSGKEVVATEIHRRSPRSKGPMISVNCAAIPAPLLESTLFGHERGAFTGAVKSTRGKFALAHGGTLFLDEIGDLPLELQAKLLRVIQEKKVEPLGSEKVIPVDVRILAATHQDLERAVREGRFRQDLLFRLNGATLRIPPLRDRKDDIRLLVSYFLSRASSSIEVSDEAYNALERHSWPGNVRELEQVVVRAAMLAEGPFITEQDLELQSLPQIAGESLSWHETGALSKLEDAQLAFTHEYVARALERNEQNRIKTAHQLGISERTLYRILSKADTDVRLT